MKIMGVFSQAVERAKWPSRRDQVPADRKSGTESAASKNVVVHVPDRCMASARIEDAKFIFAARAVKEPFRVFYLNRGSIVVGSATPISCIVPRRFDGERWIQQGLLYDSLHFVNGTLERLCDGRAWRAYFEVVRRKLSTNIGAKNLRPRSVPNLLCKRIVVRSAFCFDVLSQCSC